MNRPLKIGSGRTVENGSSGRIFLPFVVPLSRNLVSPLLLDRFAVAFISLCYFVLGFVDDECVAVVVAAACEAAANTSAISPKAV